jgi:hypothetical protein
MKVLTGLPCVKFLDALCAHGVSAEHDIRKHGLPLCTFREAFQIASGFDPVDLSPNLPRDYFTVSGPVSGKTGWMRALKLMNGCTEEKCTNVIFRPMKREDRSTFALDATTFKAMEFDHLLCKGAGGEKNFEFAKVTKWSIAKGLHERRNCDTKCSGCHHNKTILERILASEVEGSV